jgi:3-hydroxyisobutyrate dehydrogenase-like beta-hydroxyacid dehydrogenase
VGAVGFIGLGTIGAPMAVHLVGWPDGLVVFDIAPEPCAALAEKGALVATSVADVAERADVISVMVRDDDQVRDVVGEIIAAGRAGTVVAIHSTIRAETAEDLAVDASAAGIEIVDAPVSGGWVGAYEAKLAVLAGGSADAVERCRGPFERWATLIVRFGPVGAGTRAKLARNLITFVSYAAVTEAQRLAEAAGLDLLTLAHVVRHSDAVIGGPGVIMFRDTTAPLPSEHEHYELITHLRSLAEKDLHLALELGDAMDVDLPLATLALERLGPGLGLEKA